MVVTYVFLFKFYTKMGERLAKIDSFAHALSRMGDGKGRVAIIGSLGQVLTYGNVMILWRILLHLVTSGEFMSVDNFAVTSAF